MEIWEYKVLDQDVSGSDWKWRDTLNDSNQQSIQERLIELGKQGWELITVTAHVTNGGYTTQYQFYLKRPIERPIE
jgi:hypothetical protein